MAPRLWLLAEAAAQPHHHQQHHQHQQQHQQQQHGYATAAAAAAARAAEVALAESRGALLALLLPLMEGQRHLAAYRCVWGGRGATGIGRYGPPGGRALMR